MKASQTLFAGLILAAGIVYEAMALQMPRGRMGQPGPGFFPLIVGAVLILIALACLIQAVMSRHPQGVAETAPATAGRETRQSARVWLLVGLLILYAVAVQPLGFPLALMLFLLVSIRIFGFRKSLPTLGIAIGLTLISYVTFVHWLKVPLPLGILDDLLD